MFHYVFIYTHTHTLHERKKYTHLHKNIYIISAQIAGGWGRGLTPQLNFQPTQLWSLAKPWGGGVNFNPPSNAIINEIIEILQ